MIIHSLFILLFLAVSCVSSFGGSADAIYCLDKKEVDGLTCDPEKVRTLKTILESERLAREKDLEDKKSKLKITYCARNPRNVPAPFLHAPDERNNILLTQMEKKLQDSGGPSIESILGGKVVKKIGHKWFFEENSKVFGMAVRSILENIDTELFLLKGKPLDAPPVEVLDGIKIQQLPNRVVSTGSGWLIGSDWGEWGGKLAFVSRHGEQQVILNENTLGVFKGPFGYVAITGLDHLGLSRGSVYRLDQQRSGWGAEEVANLLMAPYILYPLEDESLVIGNEIGTFHVGENGVCRIAEENH